MKARPFVSILAVVLAMLANEVASAAAECEFRLGFALLRTELGASTVGGCLEDERHNPDQGDTIQRTIGGLLVWRKADNWTAFTDGHSTWVNGPLGVAHRLNSERFPWEGGGARVAVSADEIARGPTDRPWISLVFNAGSGFMVATDIGATLRERGVRTTFFPLGWWAERNPDFVRTLARDGHEIASHGHSVFDLTSVSDAEVASDLRRADDAIAPLSGRTTRPLWSPSAGYRDARVRGIAASLGYRPIFWTVDSGDWQHEATASSVRRRVLGGLENGAIVVMHTDSPRSADTVAPMLGGMIDEIRARGFRLVTITELIMGMPVAQ